MKPPTLHVLVPADPNAPIRAVMAERGSLPMGFTQRTPGRHSAGLPAHPIHSWSLKGSTEPNPRAVALLALFDISAPDPLLGDVWLNSTILVPAPDATEAERLLAREALVMGPVEEQSKQLLLGAQG